FAAGRLGNPVVQEVHTTPHHPQQFAAGTPQAFELAHVAIRDLDDAGLETLSREGHLFLSLEEMQSIQNHYRDQNREPTDIELETLAQTWSEHCVHKTLKSTVHYTGPAGDPVFSNKAGHDTHDDGSVTIHNLLKQTVAKATFDLRDQWQGTAKEGWLVSVFDDNAGIVKFDDQDGIAIKVETHNHPSALEPYGGAATGIGGCIRDIMGTGLVAKPIANTDTFCVAPPTTPADTLPAGVIHPKRVLERVVDGVRDYGNRMGIPTVNGGVVFHDDYLGNPLVYAGCVGIIPLDKCFGSPKPGDRIIILGGATGRDGIHGATFSSAELTDTHADEFSHAVQIGNAITEKKTLDVLLKARDYRAPGSAANSPTRCLFTAISDCGAGGFSSAVGEMAEKVGAKVTLDTAPLKYDGLTYTEVWISEAQERMPLSVPPENVDAIRKLCEEEDVPFCDLGEFGHQQNGEPTLELNWHGQTVGTLSLPFMHDGVPMPTRAASWEPGQRLAPERSSPKGGRRPLQKTPADLETSLLALLAHPNIASKHWIIRQYDHEVQGGSVIKPLVGPGQDGPSDAAVLRPKLDSMRAIALSNGIAQHLSEKANDDATATDGDSYYATLAAMDEAVRNAVCTGADPSHIAILDNFCWARCDDPKQLGTLVRAAEACYDGAMAYEAPFVSGKDSLSNQFTTEDGQLITIPPTMLISLLGMVNDASKCLTMDAKAPGNTLLMVGLTTNDLGGSHWVSTGHAEEGAKLTIPKLDLKTSPAHAHTIAKLIDAGHITSAHDCSEGGLLVAAAEMAFAGRIGLDLDLTHLPVDAEPTLAAKAFAENPSRYLLEVSPDHLDAAIRGLKEANLPFAQIGTFAPHNRLTLRTAATGQVLDTPLDTLRAAWLGTLDF
ncbi:MAG: AIR synthase-related protein, partial [Algisphaera sp.]